MVRIQWDKAQKNHRDTQQWIEGRVVLSLSFLNLEQSWLPALAPMLSTPHTLEEKGCAQHCFRAAGLGLGSERGITFPNPEKQAPRKPPSASGQTHS